MFSTHIPMLPCSYCGHGTGREFLSTDHFKQLNCQATSLLMGCGSGRLVVGGAGDPTGMVLSYLMAGWWVRENTHT